VPLHDGWKHLDDGQYQAPLEKQYKYGIDVDKSETKISLFTKQCINVLQDIISQWQVKSLVSLKGNDAEGGLHVSKVLSLDHWYALLQVVDNLQDAVMIQNLVKDIRQSSLQKELQWEL
jgi:ethanolamine utilization protein EutQ (cupin superfamily)